MTAPAAAPPGPAPTRPPAGDEAVLLDRLDALAAGEARLLAQRVDVLVELHAASRLAERRDGVPRYVELDVAASLRIGQVAAGLRVAEALRLHRVLTRTLAGLRAGSVLVPQAVLLLRETHSCSEQVAADAERRVFAGLGPDGLAPWVAGDLTRRVKRAVLQAEAALEPRATERREADARAGRRVVVRPEPDAMASLWALLPAEQARRFAVGLDELTRRQQQADRVAGVDRTTDQRRADLLAMLPALALHALDGTTPGPAGGHPAVVVNVHVPLATALGLSDAPGRMDGYGPVSAGTVRLLLPGARLRQVLVDEVTGEVLHTASRTSSTRSSGDAGGESRRRAQRRPADAGPRQQRARSGGDGAEQVWTALRRARDLARDDEAETAAARADGPLRRALLALVPDRPVLVQDTPEPQYRPSEPLARLVRTRDPHCTGLGCTRPSTTSELDHRTPWPLGPTSAGNLAPLSKRCHDAKTRSWALHRRPDGTSTWTSPTGRRYRVPSPWDPPPDLAQHQPAAPPEEPDLPRWPLPDTELDLTEQLDDGPGDDGPADDPPEPGQPGPRTPSPHRAPSDRPRLAVLDPQEPPF